MGYYTDFTVSAITQDPTDSLVMLFTFLQGAGYQSGPVTKKQIGDQHLARTLVAQQKWYDIAADIKEFTQDFPHAAIVVDGVGEDPGDLWRIVAYNGVFTKTPAVITYDTPKWFEKYKETANA